MNIIALDAFFKLGINSRKGSDPLIYKINEIIESLN